MVDTLSPTERSERMRKVRGKDTRPELEVRRILRELGYVGYRLHRRDIAGCPDVAFISRRKAIFVHGCFWHGHQCKLGARVPKSNTAYWLEKVAKNKLRDNESHRELRAENWLVLVIWECEVRDKATLSRKISDFMAMPSALGNTS